MKNIEDILNKKVSWLTDSGPEDDIAISSRIRLARNIKDFPFPVKFKNDDGQKVLDFIKIAVKKSECLKNPNFLQIDTMPPIDKQYLLERRLVSSEYIKSSKKPGYRCLALAQNEGSSIMINEEDHMRMQAMLPGFQLEKLWKSVDKLDDKILTELPPAYDSTLGFLTHCPTNLGTGMRASVMLHLPALVLSEKIEQIIRGTSKLGLAVRGIFGEGSNSLGSLFQISNQSTLGESENQIIDKLSSVIQQIINYEKNERDNMLEENDAFLMDHIGRAYGILKHAYSISSEESLNSLSALRLGVDLGMFSAVDIHIVNELFILVQPAHLQKFAGKHLSSEERDIYRASLIREKLN